MYEPAMEPDPEEVLYREEINHKSKEYYQTDTDHMLMKCREEKCTLNLST